MFKNKKKRIYLDYSAATPLKKEVKKAMDRYWDKDFGNAGAIHQEGRIAKKAIEDSREKIAKLLNVRPDELIFNSGGTEANNSAIYGVIESFIEKGMAIKDMHLITSRIEHPSVLAYFEHFAKKGASLDLVNIDKEGKIDLKHFRSLLKPNTILVSFMMVNNEIGTIQPIKEVSKIIRNYKKITLKNLNSPKLVFHSDAAQALLYHPFDIEKLGVDLLSLDAQKIYGPKGCGILYTKKGLEIKPLIIGGNQEKALRSGTPNTSLIVGFAKALELAFKEQKSEIRRLEKLRNYFIEKVKNEIPEADLNGSLENRLANNVNMSFPATVNDFSIIQLDEKGIACSAKSACSKESYSYVIKALGKNEEQIKNSLRFTLGKTTTKKEIDYVLKCLKELK